MSMSPGNVWLKPLIVAVTFVTVPTIPATVMLEGYDDDGAMPPTLGESRIVIDAGFENVATFVTVEPSTNVKVVVPRSVAPS